MKKIIAVMAALMFAAVLFNINVSAMSKNEYQVRYFDFVGMLERGEMTYEEFEAEVNALTSEYVDSNTDSDGVIDSVAENVSNTVTTVTTGIGDAISAVGNSVNEWISDIFSDYATTESVPTTDLKGYSCLKIEESIASTGAVMKSCTYFNGYVEVSDRSDGYKFYKTYFDDGTCYRMEYKNGKLREEKLLTDRPNAGTASSATRTIWVYGDVRNTDGTPAETDDTYVDQPTYDFSEATDNELDELLQELSEELKRQNPDLSTMEGLLESIYYRLGKLDSDDDNALLSDINKSIIALMKSNDESNKELVTALLEIRDELINSDEETEDSGTSDEESDETSENSHPNHICGTLYNVKPLDKNWLTKLFTDVTELRVEYQGNKYYLETCGCLLIDDKYYSVDMNYDSYTSIDYDFSNEDIESGFDLADGSSVFDFEWGSEFDGSSAVSTFSLRRFAPAGFLDASEIFDATQKTKLNGIVDMVRKGLDIGVPFNILMDSVKSFEGILFTTSEPRDLVITIFDTEVTILSTKFFGTADHSIVTGGIDRGGGGASGSREELYVTNETMSIVRDLSSVFIGVAWVLNMRRKVTNMI